MSYLRHIAEESGIDLEADSATSKERTVRIEGHPDPIETWYQENDIWKPWKAFIMGLGTFSGWSAREAAQAAATAAKATA